MLLVGEDNSLCGGYTNFYSNGDLCPGYGLKLHYYISSAITAYSYYWFVCNNNKLDYMWQMQILNYFEMKFVFLDTSKLDIAGHSELIIF